jgi:hypothetical protein
MAPSFFVAAQSVLRGNDENSLGLIAAAGQAYPQYLGPADVRLGTDNGAEADNSRTSHLGPKRGSPDCPLSR